ncbi:hypothetical protein FHL15_007125 [Xylaria flabelliformis]|uniref:Uncharacterized protein n=1 Tax=Xylaria flabelliformis TaxID=2512241 RepID=A0A553HVR4_9PEZI|nr:hypothetical protein FHL15_007125 [Xylaria flabelliformis]
MSSKKRQGKRSVQPPSRADPGDATDTEAGFAASDDEPVFKRRQASLYDAVAGRVTTTLPISSYESQRPPVKNHRRNAADSRRNSTLAPEEVLFKRSGAPVRYAEKDIYQAHEDLPDGGRGILPDSDLLKTIHSYASHFYRDLPANKQTAQSETGTGVSERSMDETALLAFGILLEEAGREALGKRGDLVFTEGVEVAEPKGGQSGEDEDEEAEVFGIKDALRYEARGRLKRLRESDRDA